MLAGVLHGLLETRSRELVEIYTLPDHILSSGGAVRGRSVLPESRRRAFPMARVCFHQWVYLLSKHFHRRVIVEK